MANASNENVVLILDRDEAQVLIDILNRVGGTPHGPRGKADTIARALKSVGFNSKAEDRDFEEDYEYLMYLM